MSLIGHLGTVSPIHFTGGDTAPEKSSELFTTPPGYIKPAYEFDKRELEHLYFGMLRIHC